MGRRPGVVVRPVSMDEGRRLQRISRTATDRLRATYNRYDGVMHMLAALDPATGKMYYPIRPRNVRHESQAGGIGPSCCRSGAVCRASSASSA